MLKALLARVPFFRQRSEMSQRKDQLKVDSAERRERWNQVIAEHQKPLDTPTGTTAPPK